MTYIASATRFKSSGGKGSRGVALFGHSAEATVHLIEHGSPLCGIDKSFKRSWRLSDDEAKRGQAVRGKWKLHVCKNCQTHL